MKNKAPLAAGAAVLGLVVLLLVAGSSGEQRGGVVLNRDPPKATVWGLIWDSGERAAAMPAAAPAAVPAPPAYGQTVQPAVRAPEGPPPGDSGIWATAATFSETD